jgi:hypothetical protein
LAVGNAKTFAGDSNRLERSGDGLYMFSGAVDNVMFMRRENAQSEDTEKWWDDQTGNNGGSMVA